MQDCYDAPLTFSRGQYDTMMLALLRCVYTGRNDSQVLMSMEQALTHGSISTGTNSCSAEYMSFKSVRWSKYVDMKHLV